MQENHALVPCAVCGSDEFETVYSSLQDVSDVAGEVQVDLVMCARCSFLYNNPQPTAELLAAHYLVNSSGAVYREVTPDSRAGRLTRLRADFLAPFLADRKGGRILDVGCGNGFFLASLAAEGWSRTGLDLSPQSGKEMADRGIELVVGNVLDYEPARPFDIITCFSSFEHFRRPQDVLKKLRGMLAPGGVLVLDVPDSSQPVPGLEEYFCFEHLSSFTRPTLTMFLNGHRLEVVDFAPQTPEFKSLLCAARACAAPPEQTREDPAEIRSILADYRARNAELKARIRAKLQAALAPVRERGGRIAVYGAGFHNYFLFKLIDFEDLVSCFIDGDPGKWGHSLRGKEVLPPERIAGLDVAAILISSHHFEEEIARTIARFNAAGVPVIRLYEESHGHTGTEVYRKGEIAVIDCEACGFKHILPIPTQAELDGFYSEEFYDKLWPNAIANSEADRDWYDLGFRDRYETFEELLPDPGRRALLDIGSGSGHFLKCGQDRGWQVLGIEPSATAHEFATGDLGVPVVKGAFTAENSRSFGHFDVVTMNKVFEHLRDPAEVLRLVHEILRPGGLVCITVPNDFNPLQEVAARHLGREPWWVDPTEHISYFDSASLSGLVERCGYRTEHLVTSFPLELFLLMGENYLDDDRVGKGIHNKRKQFEMILEESGHGRLRRELYGKLQTLGLGRELTIYARKPEAMLS